MERRQGVKKDGTESKTPRYVVTYWRGYFKPLDALKNANGEIVMYYQRNDKCNPNSTADVRLQCKNSINFSSIYLENPKAGEVLTGFGEPPREKALKPVRRNKKDGSTTLVERPNPFFNNRADGYLFILTPGQKDGYPDTIEILVVPQGRDLIRGYAARLADGQLNEVLNQVRNMVG
jgi:hypothetical protein